jgi:acyl-coenzyme A synthetase/AMP-(fatty) acid ligase
VKFVRRGAREFGSPTSELPRNAMGKVEKTELRRLLAGESR